MFEKLVVLIKLRVHRLIPMALLLYGAAVQGQTITKCQDEEGNWHYGDFAAEACAKESTITEIDEQGLKVKESDAPPTQEELDAQKEAERRQQEEAEREARQAARDQRLLRTYESAQEIIEARDERVVALEQDLDSHRLFREDLREEKERLEANGADAERIGNVEAQIQQYDDAIQSLEKERKETVEEYNTELDRYRELTE